MLFVSCIARMHIYEGANYAWGAIMLAPNGHVEHRGKVIKALLSGLLQLNLDRSMT
jgi:hypothetical protein